VVKAAKVARAAVKAAPVAAAAAPVAAGGIGFIVLGLGLWWLVNKATQLPAIIGDKIQDLPEAVGKLDIPGVPDIPPVWVWVPDVVQSVPDWDIPGLPELAPVWEWFPEVGPAVAQHYEEAGTSPFTGKIPGGPRFDLLAPFRGWFGGDDEPQLRDAKYRGEPVQIVTLPFKGETPEMFYQ